VAAVTSPRMRDVTSEDEVHADLRAVVAEFAAEQLAGLAEQGNARHELPIEAVTAMGDLGLFALGVPERLGGTGDFTSLCIAIEEVGRVDQSLGLTLEAAAGLGIRPVVRYGTPGQQERWLPDLLAGRALAAFGLTEPGAGSDAAATATTARREGEEWVINGAKQFITNSGTPLTSFVTITARTGRRPDGRPAISALIVPSNTAGFTVGPAYDKVSWRASDTHPLSFEDVRVPADHLLGAEGEGYAEFLATLCEGRVALAALALGAIRGCRDLACEHARQRTTFGRPIGSRQAVAFALADLDVMAEAAHHLVYAAAARHDALATSGRAADPALVRASAIAKLYATESAVAAARAATQIFGGYGVMEEYAVARFYRDVKALEIGEGTSEVQRLLVARGLGLPVD
jgi:short-chain 2-methylacyl-CoA dehydrogenase